MLSQAKFLQGCRTDFQGNPLKVDLSWFCAYSLVLFLVFIYSTHMKVKSIVLSFVMCLTMSSCVVLVPDDTDKKKTPQPTPQPEVPKPLPGYPRPELSPLVEEIAQELNTVRANPAWYGDTVLPPRLK